MLNNLFNSWRKPTEDDPVKIGDKIRFKSRIGVPCEATVEYASSRQYGARVTAYDHWGYDIGEIITVIRDKRDLEVYR